jgi:RNA polymerase sigma factor for flagellar operon FliA
MIAPTVTLEEPATQPERPSSREDLWRCYRRSSAGSQVENDLVKEYLPLVKTVVGRLAMSLPSHVALEDLYSSGLIGLLNALRHYNASIGSPFETYARLRIRGAIFDELRRMDWVPRSVHDKARKVQNAMQELEQHSGRVPNSSEMARALKISPSEYEHWLDEIRPATFVCLDAAPGPDSSDGASQYENIADHSQENPVDRTSQLELTRLIAQRLEQLPEMQRKVLALYYFEDMRLREIAEAFGLTESRICQIHSQAILAIKTFLHRHEITSA